MAIGDHPMPTPVYGGLLIVAAMLGATWVWQSALPSPVIIGSVHARPARSRVSRARSR
jgi:UDP-N-acetylmuramyl pentapeptide phosphotransferase/UDP-N-acetylglucosamine-1-phosphate transferase